MQKTAARLVLKEYISEFNNSPQAIGKSKKNEAK